MICEMIYPLKFNDAFDAFNFFPQMRQMFYKAYIKKDNIEPMSKNEKRI